MKYAVIKTGGKQYLVEEGQKLKVEKLAANEGEELQFDEVLLMVNDGEVAVGTPVVEGATVTAKVSGHGRGKKVRGLKYKRGGKRTKFGHRQEYTKIEVLDISARPPSAKASGG